MSTPVDINNVTIQDGPLPVGPLVKYGYDPITSCVFLVKHVAWPPVKNFSLVITDVAHAITDACNSVDGSGNPTIPPTGVIVSQVLAPFPPPFYDTNWYDPIGYDSLADITTDGLVYHIAYANFRAAFSNINSIILDTHIKSVVSPFDLVFTTIDGSNNETLLRPIRYQKGSNPVTYGITWVQTEDVYRYRCQGILFGGRNQAGPLNSIYIDGNNNDEGSINRILNLNEFRVNSLNEVEVDAYIGNYNASSPRVYCVLDKTKGKMAEIIVNSRVVNYFTVSVPLDSEILNLYYTSRLMYTVRNINTNALSLYDAHSNGILLHTFNLGSYDPSIPPTFTVIN